METARTFLPIAQEHQAVWQRYLDKNPHIEELFDDLLPFAESAEIEAKILVEHRIDEGVGGIIGSVLGMLGFYGVSSAANMFSGNVLPTLYDMVSKRIGEVAEKYNVPADQLLIKIRDSLIKMVTDLGVPVATIAVIARLFGYEWDSIASAVGVIVVLYVIYQIFKKNPKEGKKAADEIAQNKEKVKDKIEKAADPEDKKPVSQADEVLTQSVDYYLDRRYGIRRDKLVEQFEMRYGRAGHRKFRVFENAIKAQLHSLPQRR